MQFKYRYTEYFNENFAMFLLFIAITLFVQDVVVLSRAFQIPSYPAGQQRQLNKTFSYAVSFTSVFDTSC